MRLATARTVALLIAGGFLAVAGTAGANVDPLAAPVTPAAAYGAHPQAAVLLLKLQLDHGFSASDLDRVRAALDQAQRVPKLIEAEQKAKEKTLTWDAYRKIHVHAPNLKGGAKFLATHRGLLARAEAQYGVPPAIVAAILGVETKWGSYTGPHRVLDALATQGFEHPTRSAFFFGELVEFFALCRDFGFDPVAVKGSYAGAVGTAQFMPSNYRRLAVDFDGDGKRDLWNSADAIGSVANYLVNYAPARGWQRGLPLAIPAELSRGPGGDWPLNAKMPTHRLGDFLKVGVKPRAALPAEMPASLLELTLQSPEGTDPGKEYWIALNNFYSVMSYNPRVYYAMAVMQLADELQKAPAADAAP